ncbi:hypothetical protein O1611_g372 [Lasiodiplodia mahajangana]|uniref:Uncharacterized protein n=1 Tax=Lasiodiplodia mahajangana TaxID=1108764 RepID=A0ACC2K105_9PEZI|nr:hypothetical protein O1611_g372 [Lasiodiplodia mahajangana]
MKGGLNNFSSAVWLNDMSGSQDNSEVVVIVGAGSIGLCTAYNLAKRSSPESPHDIIIKVIDVFNQPFAGASSNCTGCLHYGFPEQQSPAIPLGKYSFDLWASEASDDSFREATGYRAQSTFGVDPGSGHGLDSLPNWVKIDSNWDVDKNVLGDRTATVNPIGVGDWLTERCKSMGVKIEVDTKIVAVGLSTDNRVQTVTCVNSKQETTTIHCTQLLLACGAWTPTVFGSLFPSSKIKLQSDKDAGDWACWNGPCPTTQTTTAFVSFANVVGDKMEFVGRNDGTIWACGRRNHTANVPPPGYQQAPDETVIGELGGYARKWINWQCNCVSAESHHDNHDSIQLIDKGRSFRPTTKSGLPIIDEVSPLDLTGNTPNFNTSPTRESSSGVFICWGHWSYGLTLGMGSGRLMSQLMRGEKPDIDISEFTLERNCERLSQPSQPPVLSNLPTEIIMLILRNFCLHCREPDGVPEIYFPSQHQRLDQPSWYALDLQALHATCLVSRRFRDIAQAILYHEFVPGYGDSYYSRQYEWTGRLTGFLRTVAQRRDLANLVRRLYLSHWLLSPIGMLESYRVEAALEESARVRGISLPDFLEPFHDLPLRKQLGPYRPRAEELVALLLSCLPNLSQLYLTMGTPRSPIPARALSAAGVLRLSLQTLEFCPGGSDLRQRLGGILEMSSSTLETLTINAYRPRDGDKLEISDLYFPSLRNIIVTMSEMSDPDLELLLSRCAGLETFIYDATSNIYCIQPSNIIKCLSRHKETLTTIRLDLRDARIIDGGFLSERTPSLQIFPTLLNVSLNALFIYNDVSEQANDDDVLCQLLPLSVTSLQIYDTVGIPTFARLSKGLRRLIDAASQGRFPSLRRVRCYVREQLGDHDLVLRFASARVCLDIILGPPSDVVPRRRRGSTSSSSSTESADDP